MRLTKKEIKEFQEITSTYTEMWRKIRKLEDKIRQFNEEKQELIDKLYKNRDREKYYSKRLIKKYGQGQLNLETMEYEIKEEV